jgi:hypothetical protein
MGDTTFELRGHNFTYRNNDMAIQHLFTFSISLRLPWAGRRWNAYCKWIEGGINQKLAGVPNGGVIAKGFGLAPTFYRSSSESMPKDVVDAEGTAALRYFRKKGATGVLIKLNIHGKKAPKLEFKMVESKPAAADEEWKMEGIFGIADLSKKQELRSSDPFSNPPDFSWSRDFR